MIISFRNAMYTAAGVILISNGPKLEAMSRSQAAKEAQATVSRSNKQKAEAGVEAAKEMSEVALSRASTCVRVSTQLDGASVETPFVNGQPIAQKQSKTDPNPQTAFSNRLVCTGTETAETDSNGQVIGSTIARVRTEDLKTYTNILKGKGLK